MARVSSRSDRPGYWLVVVAALLVALTWQNFLFQTHWHAPSPQTVGTIAADGTSTVQHQTPADPQTACLICLELANATPALPSVPAVPTFPPLAAFFLAAIVIATAPIRGPPRPWQSRAPPISLQV